jgi:hypothetical protein
MSISPEKVAPLLTPTKRKRVRPYKARVATKVKWALEDAMLGTQEAQTYMLAILALMDEARVMKDDDTAWLVHLGKLDHQIAYLALVVSQLERTVTRAMAESKPEVKCK